jgi:hypothetical protein
MFDRLEHVSQDEVAAWHLDGLPADRHSIVGEHLASGCPQCAERLDWARRLSAAAYADNLQAPPPAVLQRALALCRQDTSGQAERRITGGIRGVGGGSSRGRGRTRCPRSGDPQPPERVPCAGSL